MFVNDFAERYIHEISRKNNKLTKSSLGKKGLIHVSKEKLLSNLYFASQPISADLRRYVCRRSSSNVLRSKTAIPFLKILTVHNISQDDS